jgi:hypothetical protein
MKKRNRAFLAVLGIILAAIAGLNSCNKTESPFGIYAPNGLDVPTPTSTPIMGSFYIALTDLDKAANFTNINVIAVEPGGALTLTANSGTSGVARFAPLPAIRPGNWIIYVEPQPSSVFAPCTFSAPINSSDQTVTIVAGGASLTLVPNTITSYNSQSGGLFIYSLVYHQPNPLFVPVTFSLSSVPYNWTINSSPATLGFGSNTQGSVTVSGIYCVDTAPSFSVTAFDSTGFIRSTSLPTTVTKTFINNITLSLVTNGYNNPQLYAGGGNPSYPSIMNCSGYVVNTWYCQVYVSYSYACNQPVTVAVINHNDQGGSSCCGEGAWWSTNNYIKSQNCNSSPAQVTGGSSWPLTVVNTTDGGNPILSFRLTCNDFPSGVASSVQVPNSGSTVILNVNW